MSSLSAKQQEVYNVIKAFLQRNGQAPTLEEIGALVGIKSRAGVFAHLEALEQKGFISRSTRNRGIVLKEMLGFSAIPVLGYANAGKPLAVAEERSLGEIQVDSRILQNDGNLFGVIVSGDSMNECLVDGDLLVDGSVAVVNRGASCDNGDVVLGIIDGAATIKKLVRGKDQIILTPVSSNKSHFPIYIKDSEELFINGKVVKVLGC